MKHAMTGEDLVMPVRLGLDGPVSVARDGDDRVIITVTPGVMDHGDLGSSTQSITLSRYNAWRIFGMLAVILGIPLPSKLGKLIKF